MKQRYHTVNRHRPRTSATLESRGVSLTMNGTGERPETPSYSFRSMGTPGMGSILNAQSMCTSPRNISFSARMIPGQTRRLPVSSVVPVDAVQLVTHAVRGWRRSGSTMRLSVEQEAGSADWGCVYGRRREERMWRGLGSKHWLRA